MGNKKSSRLAGVLFGGALFLGAFPLLFWNEGRSLHRTQTLAEGREVVVEDVSSGNVTPKNEAKLVHVTGFADAHEELTDPKFNVSVNDVLKLQREVEMYQWKEQNSGDEDRPATYTQVWSAKRINSDHFDKLSKRNPKMAYESATQYANRIQFGAFQLSRSLAESIDNWERIDVSQFFAELPADLRGTADVHDQGFYVGANPKQPQIGDLRIHFSVARPTTASVIAQQAGATFQTYAATTVKGTIERLEVGEHSAGEMFTHMETENQILTWSLRAGGTFMMFMGSMIMLDPLLALLNYVPLAGRLATSVFAMIALLVSVALSFTTIAIAWLFYRPLWSVILFAIAAVVAYGASRLFNQQTSAVMKDEVVEDARIRVVQ